jgi:lactoylglutathione lyase
VKPFTLDDQKKTEDFWINKGGFEVRDRKDMGNGFSWLEVAPKDAPSALVLYPKKLMTNYAELKPSIVFYCNDIAGFCTALKQKGVFVGPLMPSTVGPPAPYSGIRRSPGHSTCRS